MGFGQQWGLVVPRAQRRARQALHGVRQARDLGSAKDIRQVGDETLVNAWMVTGGGGARHAARLPGEALGRRTSLTGEVFFGKTLTAENLGELRGQGRKITGESVAAKAQRPESSAGAGNIARRYASAGRRLGVITISGRLLS